MTRTQERVAAAMRAIGHTVTSAPPLDLPPQPAASRSSRLAWPRVTGGRAWRQWLIPAAAAAAVVAIAVSLVVVRSVVGGSAAALGGSGPAASGQATNAVPGYYVSLSSFYGWYAYAPLTGSTGPNSTAGLIVGSTFSGKPLAIVAAPKGLTFNVTTGAADDRTFVVGAVPSSALKNRTVGPPESWYVLRISPGSAQVARLTAVQIPQYSNVTGAALSPDGSELAVSYVQTVLGSPNMPAAGYPGLTVRSVATGKALRQWGAPSGQVTASAPTAKYESDAGNSTALSTALRWTPDGRELAFAWNGTAIRLLDLGSATSHRSDLVQASTVRAGIGTTYIPGGASFTCDAAEGWQLSAGAKTFTCAGAYTPMTAGACAKAMPAHPAFIQDIQLSGGVSEITTLARSADCAGANGAGAVTSLGWSSANGSSAIGVLGLRSTPNFPSPDQYGVFTSKKFTKLPALLDQASPVEVAW